MRTRRYPIWNNPDAELFHGTRKEHGDSILKNGIDPAIGESNTDFGSGFYTTTNKIQADNWAKSRASENGDKPVVLKITINRTALAELRDLCFVLPTEHYWRLVERCRDDNDPPHQTEQEYDVVYGPVAKRLSGTKEYDIINGFDQISFHGQAAKALLNDRTRCTVEVTG